MLLLALLFQEGGNLLAQQAIHDHFILSRDPTFFHQVSFSVQRMIKWHATAHKEQQRNRRTSVALNRASKNARATTSVREMDDCRLLLKAAQLMCEGHFQPNQDILR